METLKAAVNKRENSNSKEEKRRFIIIDNLPEDFLSTSDFQFDEDIVLELDF